MKLVGLDNMIEEKIVKTKKDINKYSDKEAFFQCGSRRLSHWLLTIKGIFPLESYIHKNGKTISIYAMTKDLSDALYEWTNNNPNKK